MASTPRSTIEDTYAAGKHCAICGAGALRVGHVDRLPDYVTCGECGSAFLVEDGGERVFYGQIAAGYPAAEGFALRQWAFAEAIENRARPDRPTLPEMETPGTSEPEPAISEPAPASEPEGAPLPVEPAASEPELPEMEEAPEAELPDEAEPEPEPWKAGALPADERSTRPYMEFEAGTPDEAPEEAPPEPDAAGAEFDFLAEIAAAGPAPEPGEVSPTAEEPETFDLPAFEPQQAEEPPADFLPDVLAEELAIDPFEGFEPETPEQSARDDLDFLRGLAPAADEEDAEFLPELGEQQAELDALGPQQDAGGELSTPAAEGYESEVDFLAGLEAAEAPEESEAPGLIDGDEPHPADTLTPPPWAAASAAPQAEQPAAEEPSEPSAWHEFLRAGDEDQADEPAIDFGALEEPAVAAEPGFTTEEPAEPEPDIPGEPYSFDEEDDPLGLASAFEALTPDAGPAAGEGEADEPEIPRWDSFADEEPSTPEPFAALRMEAEQSPGPFEPEEETPEPEGESFDDFDFSSRLGAFGEAEPEVEEEDKTIESASHDEDDFLSGLRRSAAIPLESEPLDDTPLAGVRLESQPFVTEDEPEEEPGEDPLAMAARMGAVTGATSGTEPLPDWMQDEPEAGPDEAPEAAEPEEPRGAFHLRETDPPPGQRYRVVLLGDRVIFPGGDCAHCGRTPVKGRLAVYGTLPNGQKVGQRKVTSFNVPLCAECRDRAALRTEEASNARLQAHLISAIVGMGLVVLSLVIGLIDPRNLAAADFMILAILFIVGYAGPVTILLNRAGNYPPPPDAVYVRTTLLVPSETQGLETAFEWRSEEYAQRFFEANQANAIGRLTAVKDRLGPVG